MFLGDIGPRAASNIPNKEIRTMKEVPRTTLAATAERSNLEQEIRKRAYELFEARGGVEGHDVEDWLRAEEEIMGSKTNAVAA
jgi:hypothetical protein